MYRLTTTDTEIVFTTEPYNKPCILTPGGIRNITINLTDDAGKLEAITHLNEKTQHSMGENLSEQLILPRIC